ncbi:hypothetical protein UFOVP208_30 [uncultured Caudovirales phage]|uniref:Lipoprotein n=1 Tax=uncultured Caudovirales phage TaxID=2100421 RepID=A0A6J7WMC0_9CAUD|nr:hypothetical protein UFOVP208_30 [uncultured Caudovirales phage]
MWKLLYSCLLCVVLSSCYTSQKANKQLNKAQLNYPELVAKKSAEWYPCKTGKVISDSSDLNRWIEQINTIDTVYKTLADTVIISSDCPKALIKYKYLLKKLPSIHDTIIIESTAKESALQLQLDEKIKECDKVKSHYISSIWFIVVALLLLIISILIKFFK